MSTLVVVLLALAAAAILTLRWFEGLPNKKKKKWFTKSVNRYFVLLENLGLPDARRPTIGTTTASIRAG